MSRVPRRLRAGRSGRGRGEEPMIRCRLPLALFAAVLASTAAAAPPPPILPLDQIKPGMLGVGRTVFEGTRIEDFKVQIIGVLENIGPKQSLILARLDGGPLEKTGVIAGMSGSPVFIDGKLVGAVSYGFPFSKETICGITPIGEMIEDTSTDTPRAASARFPMASLASGSHALAAPLDRASLMAAIQRPVSSVPLAGAAGQLPPALAAESMRPLSLPLVFSGFDAST